MNVSFIYRSRHVGQSYISSIFTTLWAFFTVIPLVYRIRPKLVRISQSINILWRVSFALDFSQWSWYMYSHSYCKFITIGRYLLNEFLLIRYTLDFIFNPSSKNRVCWKYLSGTIVIFNWSNSSILTCTYSCSVATIVRSLSENGIHR